MGPKCAFLLVHCLFLLLLQGTVEAGVVKYGLEGSREEATSPEEVVRLLKKHSVKRVTFFGANPSILRALGNSSINVKIGLYNFEAEHLAEDSNNALQWVRTNISPFMRDTNITGLYVGADVRSQMVPLAMHLELAVGNLIDALGEEQLTSRIQVSFSSSMSTYSDEFPVASLLTSKIGQNQTFVIDIRNYWTPTFTNHRRLGDGRGFVWCVVRRDANVYDVQSALNWACARVNCGPTYAGGRCFIPNSIWDHSSWAFNAYFNSMNGAPESCNFSGTAYISSNDPSSEQCFYQGTNRALVVGAANTHVRTVALSLTASLFTYLLVHLVL